MLSLIFHKANRGITTTPRSAFVSTALRRYVFLLSAHLHTASMKVRGFCTALVTYVIIFHNPNIEFTVLTYANKL